MHDFCLLTIYRLGSMLMTKEMSEMVRPGP